MVADTNVITLVGRLTKDAELKDAPGFSITFFTVATNRKSKDYNGNFIPEASFFDVNAYGKYAEIITPSLKKGVQVIITGELKQERWQDSSGSKRSRVVLVANSIQILGGKKET